MEITVSQAELFQMIDLALCNLSDSTVIGIFGRANFDAYMKYYNLKSAA